jgi:hypothetical protein
MNLKMIQHQNPKSSTGTLLFFGFRTKYFHLLIFQLKISGIADVDGAGDHF